MKPMHDPDRNTEPFYEPDEEQKKREKRRYAIITIANTVLAYGLYVILMQFYYFEYFLIFYLALLTGFALAYVIYNRGFSRMNVTPEMLPEYWSEEDKVAFIGDAKRRLRKSRWMLTVIIPLILCLLFDMAYIHLYERFILPLFS